MEIIKKLDLICLGRLAVDLYGEQIGSRLEDMNSFAKYLGGSSANVAYGTARQGLKSSMLARVGNEHMGRFLKEELLRAGVDTSNIITDKERLTALVILGIKDQDTFPLIFYRDNCADMALTKEDIKEEYIASSKALAITGTHLSHQNTREAVLTALSMAKNHGLKRILDIDYRPVLWGLTSLGDGETRYVESERVTVDLQEVLHHFDLIVGTEEEFHIAGGSTNTIKALNNVRKYSNAILVCKRGSLGCSVFENAIPKYLDEGITIKGVKVEVLNVLGAGDAFMSGFLRGYINGETLEKCCQYANACGALVVSRHGCAPAMPSREEIDYYLSRKKEILRPDLDNHLNHLHRVTSRERNWQELFLLAFDHRSQLVEMAIEANTSLNRIEELKKHILKAFIESSQVPNIKGKSGVFIDQTYGQSVLNELTGQDFWIARPVEIPGSRPLRLEHGNIGSQLISWPIEQIVKCLVFYSPDDTYALRIEQEDQIKEVYDACLKSGHEMLLELIVNNDEHSINPYVRSIQRIYNIGIKPDWWKIPPLSTSEWNKIDTIIDDRDPYCRGIVILGLGATKEKLYSGFKRTSASKYVKGFAVGRTIFSEPSKMWLQNQIDDNTLIKKIKENYIEMIQLWSNRKQ